MTPRSHSATRARRRCKRGEGKSSVDSTQAPLGLRRPRLLRGRLEARVRVDRQSLPRGVDDRGAELRQQAPVVEVAPRVAVAPMVGGERAPPCAPPPSSRASGTAGRSVGRRRRAAAAARGARCRTRRGSARPPWRRRSSDRSRSSRRSRAIAAPNPQSARPAHIPPHEQPVERCVHTCMGGLLAEEGIAFGAPRRFGDTRQQAAGVVDEEALHHRR